MLWPIALLLLMIFIIIRRWKYRKMMKLYNQLKGDTKALPILGHAFHFFGSDEKTMMGLQHFGREAINQGGVTTLWVASYVCIMVVDPPMLDILMKTVMEKSDVLRFARFLTGNGSLFAPVSIWRPRRKNLAPMFSPRNLTQFVRIFAEQSDIMTERLRSEADAGPFSLWNYMTTYAMDSVCESTLGIKVKAQEHDTHPFLQAFENCMEHITYRMKSPWLHNDFIYHLTPSCRHLTKSKNYLLDFIEQIIYEKRKEKAMEENIAKNSEDENQTNLRTFLDLLMKSEDTDDDELKEEMLVLVMAGSDTSAVGAAFTALMLAKYADVQERVYEELKAVFGNSNRPVEADDLPRLKYLDAVIKETLRLYPPVPVSARDVREDFTLPSGITLPKNIVLGINMWALHRNPRYWGDDAELFRPERFLDGATALHHPAQFMPFSYGPRNCLGYKYAMMSMTTALAAMLRRFRLLPATEGCDPDAPVRVKYNIMMKDIDNFTVRLESRKI